MNPGFLDLQVNGYGGIDFNQDDLSAEALHTACAAMRRDGVAGFLATLITEKVERLEGRLKRLAALREADPLAREMMLGVHVEGPFINPMDGFRGAHYSDAVRPADPETARRILDAGQGQVKLFTLAPEKDPGMRTTKFLASRGVRVAAGHTDASLDELKAAADAGLSLFTHCGNGCPNRLTRHDNIIQRALSLSDRLWICFIGDGIHVPLFALGNYLRAAGLESAIVVTDAMSAAGAPAGRYKLGRGEIEVGEDRVVREPGQPNLAGSAATMPLCHDNLAKTLGVSERTAEALTRTHPQRALAGQRAGASRFVRLV